MTSTGPEILHARRLPGLCRAICRHAGVPLPPAAPPDGERFVFRSGREPPELLATLLEEALLEDGAEALAAPPADLPVTRGAGPGPVEVQTGFDSPCPVAGELLAAACPDGGTAMLIAVERRDADGRLLELTWAAVPEAEPPPEASFRAAVLRIHVPR